MKNILCLAGSPEKSGNSDTLLDAFIQWMEQEWGVHVHKEYLYDIPMKPYSYENRIPTQDAEKEFWDLMDRFQKIDGLIIATPTYNFWVPAVLKNFIDRIGYVSLDYKNLNWMKQPTGLLWHLRTYFIVTGGTPSLLERCMFPFFPKTLLSLQFAYYGVRKMWGSYTGKLTFSSPAKDNPDLLKKYQNKWQSYVKKLKNDDS